MSCTQSMGRIRQGFGLLEVMFMIAIIAILAAVAGPQFANYMKTAKKSSAKSTIKALDQGIKMFQLHTNQWPARLMDLIKRPSDSAIAKKWDGEYIDKKTIPSDPWGNKYQYKINSQSGEHPYELYSYGANGKGAPKVEHISVWDE